MSTSIAVNDALRKKTLSASYANCRQCNETTMRFEWDPKKAAANRRKHGVTFEEAASTLRDTFAATDHDPDHSDDENRFVTFGISSRGRLLVVSHIDRANSIRIISARLATNSERKIYEEG